MSSRVKSTIVTGALCLLLLPACGPKGGPAVPHLQEEDAGVPAKVLERIEKYEAPAMPGVKGATQETYTLRKKAGAPVPESLTHTLACDVWRIVSDVHRVRGLKPKQVKLRHVLRALAEYTQERWQKIGGYRPWTHWNFVRSLQNREVALLATALTTHLQDKGANDPMREEEKAACQSTCSISCRQPAGASATFLACAQVCKVDAANPGPKPHKTCAQCACQQDKPVCECTTPPAPKAKP